MIAANAVTSAPLGEPANGTGEVVTPPADEIVRNVGVVAPTTPIFSPPTVKTTELVIFLGNGAWYLGVCKGFMNASGVKFKLHERYGKSVPVKLTVVFPPMSRARLWVPESNS